MKVICKFDLDDEDDAFKYNCSLRAPYMFQALVDYSQWLRGICKHGDPSQHDANACRDKFWEILGENNVDLEI